jgi:hypothetical protein
MDVIKKVLVVAVVLLIAFPLVKKMMPKAVTFDRAEKAFIAAGLPAANFQETAPGLEAVAQVSGTIGSATVDLYKYDHEGKIAKQLEYQKQDPGQAMVEAWGLAQAMGAAVQKSTPTRSARNGKFMIVATGEDPALLDRIVAVFNSL